MGVRWRPEVFEIASTTSSNPARRGRTKSKSRATLRITRCLMLVSEPFGAGTERRGVPAGLFMILLLVLGLLLVLVLRPSLLCDAGDAEVPFDGRQLVYVDVANEVHDGQLLRLGGDDEQAVGGVTAHVEVDLGVLPSAALDLHNPLPRGPELGAQVVHDAAVVLPFLVEFVGADVDALETFDDLASLAVVAVVEELRGQPEHGAVERDVGRFRGAVAEAGGVDVEALLRVKRRGGGDGQTR